MRVLVVEDERKIAGFLQRGLEDEGHRVDVARDLSEARSSVGAADYDLLLVDRMLPDGDGLSLVSELRRRRQPVPVICHRACAPRGRGGAGIRPGARLTEEDPDEILSLLRAVNGLLGRLDDAWAAQGRFTAEAAHELRTPVAALQGEIEVALRLPRSAEAYRATLVSVHEEADRLARVVQALLALARLDAGEAEGSRALVRAREIVQAAVALERLRLEEARCTVSVALGADPEIEVHVPLLELAVANLLRNAARHAKGGPVEIRVVERGGR